MRRLPCALAALAVFAMAVGASPRKTPVPPYWHYEADLRDGRRISGHAPPRDIPFEATVAGGRVVKLKFTRPPSHAKAQWAWRVTWEKGRNVYVCRSAGWTGEFTKLWDKLALPAAERFVLPRRATFRAPGAAGVAAPLAEKRPQDAPKTVLRGASIRELRLGYVGVPTAKKRR